MGMFTNTPLYGGSNHEAPVYEGYDVEFGGGYQAVTEAFEDSLELVKIVCEMDNAELALQSGKISYDRFESVYEAAIGNFFEKAKNALKKLWGKIKAFFESILRRLRAMFGDTKKFVDKYADDLRKLKLNGMKAKKYAYADFKATIDSAEGAKGIAEKEITARINQAKNAARGSKEKMDEFTKNAGEEKSFFKAFAEKIVSGADTNEKLEKGLFEKLRGGARGPEDKKEIDVNISAIIDEVKETPDFIKSLEDAQKDLDEVIKEGLDNIEELATTIQTDGKFTQNKVTKVAGKSFSKEREYTVDTDNQSAAAAAVRSQSSIINTLASVYNKAIAAARTAIEERNAENKKIINDALKYKEKK